MSLSKTARASKRQSERFSTSCYSSCLVNLLEFLGVCPSIEAHEIGPGC